MVTMKDIETLLKQRPFLPFRVVLKDGQAHDVRAAFNNVLGSNLFVIGIPRPGDDDPWPIAVSSVHVPMKDIDRLEQLTTLESSKGR